MPKSQSTASVAQGLSIDDFLTIIRDDRVKKEFNDIYEPAIKLTIDEKFAALTNTIDGLRATIDFLRNDIKTRDDQIAKLKSDNVDLSQKISDLKQKNDALEQYTRRDNLIISGIPCSFAEIAGAAGNVHTAESCNETADKIIELCRDKLNVEISKSDISIAHRLPSTGTSKPILVKFTRKSIRDDIYRSRTRLKDFNKSMPKGNGIYINEDLAPSVRAIFSEAYKSWGRNGIESVWTSNCRVLVKKNGTVHRISCMADLRSV